jgi:hypothetical protein
MHILMHNGNPVVAATTPAALMARAERGASRNRTATDKSLEWNPEFTRLFRILFDGRKRFTGYELREVELSDS